MTENTISRRDFLKLGTSGIGSLFLGRLEGLLAGEGSGIFNDSAFNPEALGADYFPSYRDSSTLKFDFSMHRAISLKELVKLDRFGDYISKFKDSNVASVKWIGTSDELGLNTETAHILVEGKNLLTLFSSKMNGNAAVINSLDTNPITEYDVFKDGCVRFTRNGNGKKEISYHFWGGVHFSRMYFDYPPKSPEIPGRGRREDIKLGQDYNESFILPSSNNKLLAVTYIGFLTKIFIRQRNSFVGLVDIPNDNIAYTFSNDGYFPLTLCFDDAVGIFRYQRDFPKTETEYPECFFSLTNLAREQNEIAISDPLLLPKLKSTGDVKIVPLSDKKQILNLMGCYEYFNGRAENIEGVIAVGKENFGEKIILPWIVVDQKDESGKRKIFELAFTSEFLKSLRSPQKRIPSLNI